MSTVERMDEAVALRGLSAYGVRFSDLVVRYGEIVVLAGPNCSGKSTVSRAVVGELEAGGSVCGTAYAHELAERMGLDLDRPMAVLSRGQLRRLGIVQALMHKPELIVLDDPTSELDEAGCIALGTVLREAAARGAAVLVTAQSTTEAETYAARVVPALTCPDEVQPTPLVASSVVDQQDVEEGSSSAAGLPQAESTTDASLRMQPGWIVERPTWMPHRRCRYGPPGDRRRLRRDQT